MLSENALNKIVAIMREEMEAHTQQVFDELYQEFNLLSQEQAGVVHEGTKCLGCGAMPIKGIRYTCLQCANFDLCKICEEKGRHAHALLQIRDPATAPDVKEAAPLPIEPILKQQEKPKEEDEEEKVPIKVEKPLYV